MIATVWDTETTGLIENRTVRLDRQPYCIEFYACCVDLSSPDVILSELDILIKPPKKELLTPKITEITGITWEMVEDKPDFYEVADTITAFLSKNDFIIAHNLSFDMEVIEIELERCGKKITWPKRRICTVEQTLHLKGKRLNLGNLYETLFDSRFEGAHRAKNDVTALARCCGELFKREFI